MDVFKYAQKLVRDLGPYPRLQVLGHSLLETKNSGITSRPPFKTIEFETLNKVPQDLSTLLWPNHTYLTAEIWHIYKMSQDSKDVSSFCTFLDLAFVEILFFFKSINEAASKHHIPIKPLIPLEDSSFDFIVNNGILSPCPLEFYLKNLWRAGLLNSFNLVNIQLLKDVDQFLDNDVGYCDFSSHAKKQSLEFFPLFHLLLRIELIWNSHFGVGQSYFRGQALRDCHALVSMIQRVLSISDIKHCRLSHKLKQFRDYSRILLEASSVCELTPDQCLSPIDPNTYHCLKSELSKEPMPPFANSLSSLEAKVGANGLCPTFLHSSLNGHKNSNSQSSQTPLEVGVLGGLGEVNAGSSGSFGFFGVFSEYGITSKSQIDLLIKTFSFSFKSRKVLDHGEYD